MTLVACSLGFWQVYWQPQLVQAAVEVRAAQENWKHYHSFFVTGVRGGGATLEAEARSEFYEKKAKLQKNLCTLSNPFIFVQILF